MIGFFYIYVLVNSTRPVTYKNHVLLSRSLNFPSRFLSPLPPSSGGSETLLADVTRCGGASTTIHSRFHDHSTRALYHSPIIIIIILAISVHLGRGAVLFRYCLANASQSARTRKTQWIRDEKSYFSCF